MTINDLRDLQPNPKATAVDTGRVAEMLRLLPGWELAGGEIAKTYRFDDYHDTIAFVNAVAWVSHRADHHPDLEVGYDRCRVRYTTHSAGGLTENDFACAARVEGLT